MTGFEFGAKAKDNHQFGIDCFSEILRYGGLNHKGLSRKELYFKWLEICEANPIEEIHTLFRDWRCTNRFEIFEWEKGLVPSFDGEIWRLHGKKGILWEGSLAEENIKGDK